MKKPLHITIPITKVDEEQRMVYGYATVEELDAHGEIITYEASKKAFSSWIGNIREMHQDVAVGKALEVEFDDDAKGVWIGARISESEDGENAWIKVKEGVLAGFSIGGRVNDAEKRQMMVNGKKAAVNVITDYDLGETSLVDNPAVASAIFQMVKSVDGKLEEAEELSKGLGRPVHWWEKQYKFSDSQSIMKADFMTYNKDSMADNRSKLAKSLWEGDMLADLAMCLSDYIYWKAWEGEDMAALKTALESIKEAAAAEILEPEDFPEVSTAIENAAKALNISKREELTKMSKDIKDRNKSVTGSEDRDADANVVVSAEENGRPVNDTEERATEAGVPVAGAEVEVEVEVEKPVLDEEGNPKVDKEGNEVTETVTETQTKVQPLVNGEGQELVEVDEDEDNGEENSEDADPKADEDAADDKDSKSGKGGKGKKFVPAADLKKSSSDNDLAKSILSGVAELIEKSVAPLKEEIETLKKQPAASKVRKTYTVKKGEDGVDDTSDDNSKEGKLRKEFDQLNARADELAKDANAGTPQERMQVAFKLRKLARQLDPVSVAKNEAVRATFNREQ